MAELLCVRAEMEERVGADYLTGRPGLRIAGICGAFEPVVVSISVLLAIFYAPWFSWTDNALSDLGVHVESAGLFNMGLIVGGVLTGVFAAGLGRGLKSRLGRLGAFVVMLDAVALSAIGVFPETAGVLHFYVSVAFFTLLSSYLLIYGAAFILESATVKLGLFSILLGVVSAAVWIFSWEGVAIPEALAFLAGSAWSITMGVRLFRQRIS